MDAESIDNHYQFLGLANFATRHDVAAALERNSRHAALLEQTNPAQAQEILGRLDLVREDLLSSNGRKAVYDNSLGLQPGEPATQALVAAATVSDSSPDPDVLKTSSSPREPATATADVQQTQSLPNIPATNVSPSGQANIRSAAFVTGALVFVAALGASLIAALYVANPPEHTTAPPTRTIRQIATSARILRHAVLNFQRDVAFAFGPKHDGYDLPNTAAGTAYRAITCQAYILQIHDYGAYETRSRRWFEWEGAPNVFGSAATVAERSDIYNVTHYPHGRPGVLPRSTFPTTGVQESNYRLKFVDGTWKVSDYFYNGRDGAHGVWLHSARQDIKPVCPHL